MKSYSVVFAPEADDQLQELYLYIATRASPATAERYTSSIVSYCEGLGTFTHRGVSRDDIRAGLRLTNYKGRTVIAFAVDDSARKVSILGVFYGGQDYETTLRSDFED